MISSRYAVSETDCNVAYIMTAQEQVLYFIAANDQPTDATPIMIGLFLFTQDLKAGDLPPVAEPFEFVPMSHRPRDMKIYCVLDVLCKDGHVAEVPVRGEAWSRYRVTTEGQRAAAQIEIRSNRSTVRPSPRRYRATRLT